jgi:putative endonuclease
MPNYFVYMVRCAGGQLYTGITTDIGRRLREHLSGKEPGARYTRLNPPVELEALWAAEGRAAASRLEYRIKRLSRAQKEGFIADPSLAGEDYRPLWPQA